MSRSAGVDDLEHALAHSLGGTHILRSEVQHDPPFANQAVFSGFVSVLGVTSEMELSAVCLECDLVPRDREVDPRDERATVGTNGVLTDDPLDAAQAALKSKLQRRLRRSALALCLVEELQQNFRPTLSRAM